MIESENGKIWGMSTTFSKHPFRIVIRQIGISVIKEDTFVTSISNQIKQTMIEIESK
jgi:hypothetical protein